jgi:hypothetical protein
VIWQEPDSVEIDGRETEEDDEDEYRGATLLPSAAVGFGLGKYEDSCFGLVGFIFFV